MARDARTESPDSGDRPENEKKPTSRRPPNTAFRQQRLKAWQPILTPKTVIPLFFIFGIIFAPLGGLMIYASSQVQELVIDYTTCTQPANSGGAPFTNNGSDLSAHADVPSFVSNFQTSLGSGQNPQWVQWSRSVAYYQGQPVTNNASLPAGAQPFNVTTNMCTLIFQIPNDIGGSSSNPVLLYYRLTNFYQNHRRYVKSFDSDQLSGQALSASVINGSSCDPLTSTGNTPYYPCGIVANSMFNDTFNPPQALNAPGANSLVTYNMTNQGIAWASDAQLYTNTLAYDVNAIAVPPFWQNRWKDGKYTTGNPPPNLQTYEELQVWMRTAGLPSFNKLALRNDNETMTNGRYRLDINMNFPVTEYGGTKSVVISTTGVIGGKNPFLGIAFCVVAGLCLLLGLLFTGARLVKPRKLGDHTHLTWNNDNAPAATATSTGVSRPGHEAT